MKLIIHTDGGARGNPGPAGIGVVISDGRNEIAAFGKKIGETTNNIAEYTAVIEALNWLKNNNLEQTEVSFFLDSTLVVNQINGLFKVKQGHLQELLMKVRVLEQEVGGTITYAAVRRELNTRADQMVNEALDRKEQ